MSVVQRIIEVADAESSSTVFCTKIGIASGHLFSLKKNLDGGANSKLLGSILSAYPNLNARWLVTGEGPMWLDGEPPAVGMPAGDHGPGNVTLYRAKATSEDFAAQLRDKEEIITLLKEKIARLEADLQKLTGVDGL